MLEPNSPFFKWFASAGIYLIYVLALSILILLIYFVLKICDKLWPGFLRRIPDIVRSKSSIIERDYERPEIKADKIIVFGQNEFSYNSRKKKILIRTYMNSDGMLLDYKDIVSFEVFEEDLSSAQCRALEIKIKTCNNAYGNIVIPFISTPVEKPGFVYDSASEAVKEVTAVLEVVGTSSR